MNIDNLTIQPLGTGPITDSTLSPVDGLPVRGESTSNNGARLELYEVAYYLRKLNEVGVRAVIAGGAARDYYHGHLVKDVDIFVLSDTPFDFEAESDEEEGMFMAELLRQLGASDVEVVTGDEAKYDGRGDGDRLVYVVKAVWASRNVDVLRYSAAIPDGLTQAQNFDTTLNGVWFALDDTSPDGVSLEETEEFRQVLSGLAPVRAQRTIDGSLPQRMAYLKDKYPEYEYDLTDPRDNPFQAELPEVPPTPRTLSEDI